MVSKEQDISDIEKLLKAAKHDYQHAAAMHFMEKVSFHGGRISALEDILKLLKVQQ